MSARMYEDAKVIMPDGTVRDMTGEDLAEVQRLERERANKAQEKFDEAERATSKEVQEKQDNEGLLPGERWVRQTVEDGFGGRVIRWMKKFVGKPSDDTVATIDRTIQGPPSQRPR